MPIAGNHLRLRAASVKFASNIYLVPRKTFVELADRVVPRNEQDECYVDQPWSIWNRVIKERKAYTDNAADCNVGGFTNGQHVSLFHLLPTGLVPHLVRQQLGQDAENLKQEGRVRALLTGGHAFNGPRGHASRQLYEALMDVMRACGLEDSLTRIWGRKNEKVSGYTDALYTAEDDSWYLAVTARGKDVLSLRGLRDTFEVVDIAGGDRLLTPDDPGYHDHIRQKLSK